MAETREFEIEDDDRMSEQEALMWNVEKDPWLNPNGGAVTIYDKPIDVEKFRRTMREAVSRVPRFYQRVVPGFGRLATPAGSPRHAYVSGESARPIGPAT